MINITQQYVKDLREKIYKKIFELPINYFNKKNNGEILSLLTNDIGNINFSLMAIIREVITEILNVAGAIIMLSLINPLLILINILIMIINICIILFFSKRSQKYFKEKQEIVANLNNKTEETYTGKYTLNLFNNADIVKEKFEEENEHYKNISVKADYIASLAGSSLSLMENISIATIALISAFLNINGLIEIGYIYTIINYTTTLSKPFTKIGDIINEIMNILTSSRRIYRFIDDNIEIDNRTNPNLFENKYLVDTIFFSYNKENNVINGLNMEIEKGKKIAIIGKTGCGKTTLAKLLMNIYNVDNGKILMDKTNINNFNEEKYIKNFSVIEQDIHLFTDTIMENIKYGNEKITDEQIIEMAKEIGLNDVFMNLEDGYNTFITDNSNISYGIKQLIVLMRSIISDCDVLIFDEATNMLNTELKCKIDNAINKLRGKKTIIVIAHQLESIKDADIIYVMDDGKIVEFGTHEELINTGEIYKNMILY